MTIKTGNLPNEDPIIRFVEKENSDELSQMNPSDAYSQQNIKPIPYENYNRS